MAALIISRSFGVIEDPFDDPVIRPKMREVDWELLRAGLLDAVPRVDFRGVTTAPQTSRRSAEEESTSKRTMNKTRSDQPCCSVKTNNY
jgi:hypothetical protein